MLGFWEEAGGGRAPSPVAAESETTQCPLCLKTAGTLRERTRPVGDRGLREPTEWEGAVGTPVSRSAVWGVGITAPFRPVPCSPGPQLGGTQAIQMAGREDSTCGQHSGHPSSAWPAAARLWGAEAAGVCARPSQGPLGGRGALASGLAP